MKRFFLSLWLVASAVAADVLPTDRPASWQAGVYTGVPGGIPSGSWTSIYNVMDYGADDTGVASSQSAYEAASAAGGTNSIVYFPAGTFLLTGMTAKSNQVVRGAGMFATTINYSGSAAYSGGTSPTWADTVYNPTGDVTSGWTRGSTVIQVTNDNAVAFTTGKIIRFTVENDWTQPVTGYNDTENLRIMVNYVTNATSLGSDVYELTLAVPVPQAWTATSGNPIRAQSMQPSQVTMLNYGIEDVTVVSTNFAQKGLDFGDMTYGAWAKNVRIEDYNNYAVFLQGGVGYEITGCFIGEGGSFSPSHAGVFASLMSGGLVTNNIVYRSYSGFLVQSATMSSAFCYNLIVNCPVTLSTNHASHPAYNIYEGNIVEHVIADGYHGSSSHDSLVRNWVLALDLPENPTFSSGIPVSASESYGISLKRWTRNYALLGNIFGTPGYTTYANGEDRMSMGQPNLGNGNSYGTASLLGTGGASAWEDWDTVTGKPRAWTAEVVSRTDFNGSIYTTGVFNITAGSTTEFSDRIATAVANHSWFSNQAQFQIRESGGSGYNTGYTTALTGTEFTLSSVSLGVPAVSTVVSVSAGAQGFQELDLDVEATTTTKGNYQFNGVLYFDSLGADTLADSYIYPSGAPAFMTGYAWPPFEPETAIGTLTIARIRAGQNYLDFLANGSFDTNDTPPSDGTPAYNVGKRRVRRR